MGRRPAVRRPTGRRARLIERQAEVIEAEPLHEVTVTLRLPYRQYFMLFFVLRMWALGGWREISPGRPPHNAKIVEWVIAKSERRIERMLGGKERVTAAIRRIGRYTTHQNINDLGLLARITAKKTKHG